MCAKTLGQMHEQCCQQSVSRNDVTHVTQVVPTRLFILVAFSEKLKKNWDVFNVILYPYISTFRRHMGENVQNCLESSYELRNLNLSRISKEKKTAKNLCDEYKINKECVYSTICQQWSLFHLISFVFDSCCSSCCVLFQMWCLLILKSLIIKVYACFSAFKNNK